jgi:dTDP-4-dehydrorhamnose reductase
MTDRSFLQFGASGQLGRELVRDAASRNTRLQVLSREVADFTDPDSIRRAVLELPNVEAVVNAVAYTAVDRAESEEGLARIVNEDAVRVLARACAERGIPLVHVSTDYVYDGEKCGPYVETDRTNPLSAYGRTKLAGEEAIRESGVRHAILRTSWLYSSIGSNFVKTILRVGAERDELRVVEDQHGSPTSAADLAGAVLQIATQLTKRDDCDVCGTFHYAGEGATSWYRFAETILAMARDGFPIRAKVVPIKANEYPGVARRPRNSRLDCAKIEAAFGIAPAPWQSALAGVLNELREERAS